ncbi:MAG: DUF3817 domain-containing protein [Candidatus Nanopelagicales bacterium]|jgi:integral membrane protein
MSGAFLRYRIMAWVTGVVLATATVWAVTGYLFLDYSDAQSKPAVYGLMWIGHGWLYVLYLITGVDLAFRVRYSVPRTLLILLAGTIPFASFFAEAAVHRDLIRRGVIGEAATTGSTA